MPVQMRLGFTVAVTLLFLPGALAAQNGAPVGAEVLLEPGESSALPVVQPNDNRVAAGESVDGVRAIALEVVRSRWYVETETGPGLRVAAIAEEGELPSIPAPLIRVEEGERVRAAIRNGLEGPITVFGLHTRPGDPDGEPFVVGPGETETVEFDPGAPGTYMYWILEDGALDEDFEGERTQTLGALVVDPEGGSPPDRVIVMNIFSVPVGENDGYEALTMNGLSWPFAETVRLEVGETQRWRILNGSDRNHPMHLHGFYYSVLSRGTATGDTVYAPRDRRLVVTETMRHKRSMLMEWTPSRSGKWLFHCHLSFHVADHVRLPGFEASSAELAHSHMAGLVLGIDVAPGESDLVFTGDTHLVELWANEYGDEDGYRYGFALSPDARPDRLSEAPGPTLVFHQFDDVSVTVRNRMSVPTGVHWHGLELDSWADGVPDWSASDGRVSPVIRPGEDFTYRLATMRPGTFIYHSHLDDIRQLTGGLYGPLIVLPQGEDFDPETDHILSWGWSSTRPGGQPSNYDLNGRQEQPPGSTQVGVTHRFRLLNIAPAGNITAWMTRDGERIPVVLRAKDGADLPEHQQVPVPELERLFVGETADFTWTPSEPGVYELHVGSPRVNFAQRWEVAPAGG